MTNFDDLYVRASVSSSREALICRPVVIRGEFPWLSSLRTLMNEWCNAGKGNDIARNVHHSLCSAYVYCCSLFCCLELPSSTLKYHDASRLTYDTTAVLNLLFSVYALGGFTWTLFV